MNFTVCELSQYKKIKQKKMIKQLKLTFYI